MEWCGCIQPVHNSDASFDIYFLFIYLAVLGRSCSMQGLWLQYVGSSSLARDRTQAPLHWAYGVLVTGPPGKSLLICFKDAVHRFSGKWSCYPACWPPGRDQVALRAECRHFVLFQRHACRWRSLLHHRCACTMPSCPLASAEGESDMLWAGWKFPRADIFLSPLVTGLVTWKMWVRKSCVWGKRERESGDLVWGGHMQSSETGNLVRSGLHYPASGVGEAGYPFGSRRLFSCCFLVWIWLRLGKVVIVLWIHRG